MSLTVLLRGGGDLASGAALRLARAGMAVVITELPEPLAVRRLVSYAQAVYSREMTIEGITARRAADLAEAAALLAAGSIPVLVDPRAEARHTLLPQVIVDGRMTKQAPDLGMDAAPLVIGLGPGFIAGENCHAVVETKRGPYLGRVIWEGSAEADTGQPDPVAAREGERVLRAPLDGVLENKVEIGSFVTAGQVLATVAGVPLRTAFDGYLRGLLQTGLVVRRGLKIGDVDPRPDPRLVHLVSDKALAIGGGVLEAILSRPDLRAKMC
jgi:xanthine dehydrogenase accessory factor